MSICIYWKLESIKQNFDPTPSYINAGPFSSDLNRDSLPLKKATLILKMLDITAHFVEY